MPKIDESQFKTMVRDDPRIERKIVNGFPYFKGPWLPDWYDNYVEMLRDNQNVRRIKLQKDMGLNEHAQTPEQEKAFFKKKAVQEDRRKKAELAAEMVKQNA